MRAMGKPQCDEKLWRPADEAEATGNVATFIEWARATHAAPADVRDPSSLQDWARHEPAACGLAAANFAGLRPEAGLQANLLRHRGSRIALRVWSADGAYQLWSRDSLRDGDSPVAAVLARGTWDDLTRLASSHVLAVDTRPDDTIQWLGAPDALWPLGAWIVGACVVLGGPEQPGARIFVDAV